MDAHAGLKVSRVPVVRCLVLKAQVNQDSHAREGQEQWLLGPWLGAFIPNSSHPPVGPWGSSAFGGQLPGHYLLSLP